MCVSEARPTVLVIFILRYAAGAVLGAPAAHVHGHVARTLLTLLVWESAVFAVYLFNGVMDVKEDRANGSSRPIARGDLPVAAAVGAVVPATVLALLGGLLVGQAVFVYVVVYLLFGFGYSGPPVYLKRSPIGSPVTGMALGLLTYLAADSAYAGGGWTAPGTTLTVFVAGTTLWMGLVGAPAKDLSDVRGDREAGRRTLPVLLGEARARRLAVATAASVGAVVCAAAATLAPLLMWPGLVMLSGAGAMAWMCLGGHCEGRRLRRRRPYRVFMVTQYLVQISAITAALTELWLRV
jgi:4-hydroxybenzoate polyprenyltransferase